MNEKIGTNGTDVNKRKKKETDGSNQFTFKVSCCNYHGMNNYFLMRLFPQPKLDVTEIYF